MDSRITVFLVVVLFACLRGYLQRRHVKQELEERLAKARLKKPVKRLPGRLKTDADDVNVGTEPSGGNRGG